MTAEEESDSRGGLGQGGHKVEKNLGTDVWVRLG